LIRSGLPPRTPAAVISNATTEQERILVSTLEHLAADARKQDFQPPAIVVIGEIVAARERLRELAAAELVP
jgi:uroporphyrin-III C-methyltransferase